MSLLTLSQRPIREDATNTGTNSRCNTYYYNKKIQHVYEMMHDRQDATYANLSGTGIQTININVQVIYVTTKLNVD